MKSGFLVLMIMCLFCFYSKAQVALGTGTYTENFNSLVGVGTSSVTPSGWAFAETGTGANSTYTANNGSSNAGDTYSYGETGSSDRAFGTLQSGTVTASIGAGFTNATGSIIVSLTIQYTGEAWRVGTVNRQDKLNFQYSTNATSITSGTWTDVNQLSFFTPNATVTGALVGNNSPNFTNLSYTITGLNIASNAGFFIRWIDVNASGADDGLAVDDFQITATTSGGLPILSTGNVATPEGNSGTTNFNFTISLSSPAPAGGVQFDVNTQDNTATAGSDYVANMLTGQVIAAGNSSYTFTVVVQGDILAETNEDFKVNVTNISNAIAANAVGTGTILNDDPINIHDVQGNGAVSPFVGSTVMLTGIVTGARSTGYFIQNADDMVDGDPLSSEGIFIYTANSPGAIATTSNLVQVSGTVSEHIPSATPTAAPTTEINAVTSSVLISAGNVLPTPVILSQSFPFAGGAVTQLEAVEHMRITLSGALVSAPTDGSINEASATSSSSGIFYIVASGNSLPMRETGVDIRETLPNGAPPTVTRWDGNPEVIKVNSKGLQGTTAVEVSRNALLSNIAGIMDVDNGAYTIDLQAGYTVSNNNAPVVAVPVTTTPQFTIASVNVERFFDDVDDPGIGEPILTTAAYNNRLQKLSLAINNTLRLPDVVCFEEVEKLSVLQQIATRINNDAIAFGNPTPGYVAYLVEGNDAGGIDVGILVKPGRFSVNTVQQYGSTATYINPNNSLAETLNDRPPLVMTGSFTNPINQTVYAMTIIVNHLRSLNGVSDAVEGNRVRTKRAKQAEYLASLLQSFYNTDNTVKLISVGDYNAFEFSDGYADVLGTVKGTPAPAANVVVASPDLVQPDLTDLITGYPATERYTYNFGGNAQVLDHIVINPAMLTYSNTFFIPRLNADFPESRRNTSIIPDRYSDHDPVWAAFDFSTALPVHLTSFTARKINKMADLRWEIQDEEPHTVFQVERSSMLSSPWKIIKTVQGNFITAGSSYSVIDSIPDAGINLYRLKINSPGNPLLLSDVKKLDFTSKASFVLETNPVRNQLIIKTTTNTLVADVQIFDLSGRKVFSKILLNSNGIIACSIEQLPAGEYIVQLAGEDGSHFGLPFIKL